VVGHISEGKEPNSISREVKKAGAEKAREKRNKNREIHKRRKNFEGPKGVTRAPPLGEKKRSLTSTRKGHS